MPKKVFICGPMTGYPDNNVPAFNAMATKYREQGCEVINPADNGPYEKHSDYLRASIPQVMECDTIVLLPGWSDSEGAKTEYAVANVCGLEVWVDLLSIGSDSHPYRRRADEQVSDDETVLAEAARITSGTRNKEYGEPKDNHECTADLWNAYLERKHSIAIYLEPRDVCILNILQKISRDANMEKRDNLVDICGWARNIEMLD